jgi:hypothetical protein
LAKTRTSFRPNNDAARRNRGPLAKPLVRRGRAALLWLLGCVDTDGRNNWHKVWHIVLLKTFKGDMRAAALLLGYAIGAPRQSIDLTTAEHIDAVPPITPDMDLRTAMSIYTRTINAVGRPGDNGDLDAEPPPPPMPIIDIEAACENYRRVSYPSGEDEDYGGDGETAKSVSAPRHRIAQKKG